MYLLYHVCGKVINDLLSHREKMKKKKEKLALHLNRPNGAQHSFNIYIYMCKYSLRETALFNI